LKVKQLGLVNRDDLTAAPSVPMLTEGLLAIVQPLLRILLRLLLEGLLLLAEGLFHLHRIGVARPSYRMLFSRTTSRHSLNSGVLRGTQGYSQVL
jgi:hypothetical protein